MEKGVKDQWMSKYICKMIKVINKDLELNDDHDE